MENLIRKEILEYGTFGGNFPYGINYPELPEKCIDITEEQRIFIDDNKSKLVYDETQDGIFVNPIGIVDISDTQEYKDKIALVAKNATIAELKLQIEELDKKRIRAVCEMEIKDPTIKIYLL